jgi:predicted CoA-substrate-specific enzyme activase
MDIIVGIDAGMETVKLVMLSDGGMLYSGTVFAGTEAMSQIAEKMLRQAIRETGISADAIRLIGGTGTNASEVSLIQEEVPEAICCPLGINWISPQAHTLLDVGASKFMAMKCQQGRAMKIARSDRCASGVGISLRMVANVLAMNIEDIGQASRRSKEELTIQSTCSVFAETEIISLLHHYKKRREDILKGVFRGMASRFYSLLLTIVIEDDMYMIGGVAKNEGVVRALQDISGHPVLVPPDPDIVGALGAALAISNEGVTS